MDKLKMMTKDLTLENIEIIGKLFPNVITEAKDEHGKLKKAIDFELLKQELSADVVDGEKERYQLTWPGKKEAIYLANSPIQKTIRPVKEDSVDWDKTENMYIEGDNLDVLKMLQESYLNKIKCIYIDPPYNTGNDFIYNDSFSMDRDEYNEKSGYLDDEGNIQFKKNEKTNPKYHSNWCSMIYPRLKLARNLLSEDGVIFISIDENEVDNLKKIACEVFGSSNFAGEIIWKNSSKNDQAYISIQHEYIICFVKNKSVNLGEWYEPKEGVDEIIDTFNSFKEKFGNDWEAIHKAALEWYKQFSESNPLYASKHYSWMDEKGVYFAADISGPNFGQYRYDVTHPVTGKVCKEPASGWRYPENTMVDRIKQGLVHFGKDETTVPNNKTYLLQTVNQSLASVKYKDGRVASKQLTALMGGNYFTNPKDVSVLMSLMNAISLQDGDIILDFFAGSSSTAQAIMQINADNNKKCSFIMVQLPENLDELLSKATGSSRQVLTSSIEFCDKLHCPHLLTEIGKERIRRAGDKIKAENPDKELDIGFRVLRVDSTNMKDVYYTPAQTDQIMLKGLESNIKDDRTSEDLLIQVMLDFGLELSLPMEIKEIQGKKVHYVAGNSLIACFDKGIDDSLVKEIAKESPLRVVFRDSSFGYAHDRINVEEIFKMLSPDTEVKVI